MCSGLTFTHAANIGIVDVCLMMLSDLWLESISRHTTNLSKVLAEVTQASGRQQEQIQLEQEKLFSFRLVRIIPDIPLNSSVYFGYSSVGFLLILICATSGTGRGDFSRCNSLFFEACFFKITRKSLHGSDVCKLSHRIR